jgi:heme A synthase
MYHMVTGSLAFLALIAACFVLARPFAANHQRSHATTLRVAGAIFAVGLVESFTGGPLGSLVLHVTASIALIALVLSARWLESSASHSVPPATL